MDMKEFVRVIQIPTANGQRLQEYGLIHCIFFALTIAAMVFAVIYTLKKGEKNLYFLYVLSSVLMWVGELYKQFCYWFKTGTFRLVLFPVAVLLYAAIHVFVLRDCEKRKTLRRGFGVQRDLRPVCGYLRNALSEYDRG